MREQIQNLVYRKATAADIDLLTKTRIEVLLAANGLPDSTDMSEVEKQSRAYYEQAIPGGTPKVRQLLNNLFGDINSKFDLFTYRGRRLSSYSDSISWSDALVEVVENELYNEKGENDTRAYTNVEAAFSKIKLEFYHSMIEI